MSLHCSKLIKKRIVTVLFVAGFGLCTLQFGACAVAQTSSPKTPEGIAVQGTVRNSGGDAVADASVLLEEKGQSNSQQAKTDGAGKFTFAVRRSGTYIITAEKSGIRSHPIDALQLAAGPAKNISLVLDTSAASATPGQMEFEDKPNFTVAGVTDWSGAGGHGSDTSLRTSESLARDTWALKPGETKGSSAGAAAKDADAHRVKGRADENSGDSLGAVREFELATSLDPSERNYFAWGAELLLHRAVSPAELVFKKGTSAHPDSARMWAALGAALYSGGSYEQAAEAVCRASDLQPESATPYLFLGKMEIAAPIGLPCGDQKLERFFRQQPGNALANYYFAMVLLKRERDSKDPADAKKAQALFEKAASIDPNLSEAHLQLGILFAEQGEAEKAIAEYLNAIRVAPQLSQAHYRLSQVYKRTGEKAKAQQEIELYRQAEKTEADEVERQRREVQQFLIILKEPAAEKKE